MESEESRGMVASLGGIDCTGHDLRQKDKGGPPGLRTHGVVIVEDKSGLDLFGCSIMLQIWTTTGTVLTASLPNVFFIKNQSD